MTTTNPAVTAITALVANLRADQEHVRQEITRLEHQIEAALTTLHLLTNEEETSTPSVHVASIEDVKGCSSHRNALDKIESIDGQVNASAAARLLIQAGLSMSKPRNLTSSLYNIMQKSDEWEWVSPGTFERVHLVGQTGYQTPVKVNVFPPGTEMTFIGLDNA